MELRIISHTLLLIKLLLDNLIFSYFNVRERMSVCKTSLSHSDSGFTSKVTRQKTLITHHSWGFYIIFFRDVYLPTHSR